MPRLARNVFPGIPHHVTQRGNRRENVFFTDEDRFIYLKWLKEYSKKYSVDVLAYCLMTNHVHLVLKPKKEDGLHKLLKPLHMRYAQRINKEKGWKGHLWQGRFFSSPLDDAYTWSAIRYVERNPVRAGLVERAEDFAWSSAAVHCGLKKSSMLFQFKDVSTAIPEREWSDWLSFSGIKEDVEILRRNVEKGLPCGSDNFINGLERLSNRQLRYQPQGRPFKGKRPL